MKRIVQLTYTAKFAQMTIRRKYTLPDDDAALAQKRQELHERDVSYILEWVEDKS